MTNSKPCRYNCGKNIIVKQVEGKWLPFNEDGSRHYCRKDMPQAPQHQQQQQKARPQEREDQEEPSTKKATRSKAYGESRYEKYGNFNGNLHFTFMIQRTYKVTIRATSKKEALKQLKEQELTEPEFQHIYQTEQIDEDIKTESIKPEFNG